MKVTSALVFDIGVYLAVIGLAMTVFQSSATTPTCRRPMRPPNAASPRERLDGVHGGGAVRRGHVPVLQRKLSRLIIGLASIGHGANVVFVTATRRSRAPLIGSGHPSEFADLLPRRSCSRRS